ncbi:hypothetical protein [Alloyangia pacifica]|uniref:Uncharacterized protein n=1 Tax=Alloyangia pacifica TaxID=311180 RepID=A0A1I6PNP2_9RHOB|nr:hypothetical protein [Alloyangia pacifica]SDG31988.1 hypothetical protein SAMN04488245_102358 [Alloyangia pacifica]SFS41655.1 hypothetical protein SAMN04488050_101659 [Alloyangia pacifica]
MPQIVATFPDTSKVFQISEQINDARRYSLEYTRARVNEAQDRGDLPKDSSDLSMTLRSRGRESRLTLGNVRLNRLNIPYEIIVEGERADVAEVIKAARWALEQLWRRAPEDTGYYRDHVALMLNGRVVDASSLSPDNVGPDDELWVTIPDTSYAAIIEAGFAEGKYDESPYRGRLRNGIVYPLLHAARSRFSRSVDIRFSYIALGIRAGRRGGTAPVLEFAPRGAFGAIRDARPGDWKKPRGRAKRR